LTVIVPHNKTQQEAIGIIDRAAGDLFDGAAGDSVQIVDPKKEWSGSTMAFSLTGQVGFIKVPLSGTVDVDQQNVTVTCELPAMVRNFVGEEKVKAGIAEKVGELMAG